MTTRVLPPRLVVAGVASGVGKTTIATGLLAAFRARGVAVAGAKVGPDFIDPGYHALASGRPGRNLDPWLCGPDRVPALAGRAGAGADLLIIEGVMGLFDGAGDGEPSSTADVAALLDAPVVLVVDASAMADSVAAVVGGFRHHDPRVHLAGVICNQVGSAYHEDLLRRALEPAGVPVLGCVHRRDAFDWRDRHLGLIPVAERPDQIARSLERLAAVVAEAVDLAALERLAATAPATTVAAPALPAPQGRSRLAVADGPAFTFSYVDNLEAFAAAGAEVVPFDPLQCEALPDDVDGLLVGGGFPEVFGEQLSANRALAADVATRITNGLVTWAECGGLLWLADTLDGRPMVGAVPTAAHLGRRLHLGYRRGVTTGPSPVGPAGTVLRGHEHHYSTCDPAGGGLLLTSPRGTTGDGFASETVLATYLHHHAGGDPAPVAAMARAMATRRTAL
jgi:cobyrinic acid a,c-diamide synthase